MSKSETDVHKYITAMDIKELYEIFLQNPVITTDSRNCPKDSIFFALKGETFDGNTFASKALELGCRYAVVDNPDIEAGNGIIKVDNTLETLQKLANMHRRTLKTKVIAITGTNGKTTTKELIASVLSKKFNVLYTQGNFNNHIGVPLTLLRLRPEHEIAVVEMGANHPGEIKTLVGIADPDYGIITNVGKAHLQGFGSFEGVIRTKGELYDYLRQKGNCTIFINNDNPHLLAISHDLNAVAYGQADDNALFVNGELTENDTPYMSFRWKRHGHEWNEVQTHLIGAYNIDNALAAATIGTYFGVSDADAAKAIADYIPSNNRSQLKKTAENTLIIDAYNANPTSMGASLHNFENIKAEHKMCILGDMKELGEYSKAEHQKVVDTLQNSGIEKVWLVGNMFEGTEHPEEFRTFGNVDEVKEAIKAEAPKGMTILIKGSNSTKLYELPEML